MKHNLKALGVALVATLAMSALAASAAHATEGAFSWDSGTKFLTAEQDPTDPSQSFTIFGESMTFTCNEFSSKATVEGTGATTVQMNAGTYADTGTTPEEDKCTGPFGTKPRWAANGCQYRLHVGTTVGVLAEGTTEGTADLVCPEGKEVEMTAPGVTLKFPPQEGLGPVFFKTVEVGGKEALTVETKFCHAGTHKGCTKYSTSGILIGNHPNETDGTYTSKLTIRGSKEDGTQTNLTVT